VEFISPILINFQKTRKLIKNNENNFTISLILVDFRDFRQRAIKWKQKVVLVVFEKIPQIVETTRRDCMAEGNSRGTLSKMSNSSEYINQNALSKCDQ
jgi:hypothetical protein